MKTQHPWEVLRKEAGLCCSHHRYMKMTRALDDLRPMLLDMLSTYTIEHGPKYETFQKLLRKEGEND